GVRAGKFSHAPIASQWFDFVDPPLAGTPPLGVSFSPHVAIDSQVMPGTPSTLSLDRVHEAIQGARSSVLFAVMELGGSGLALSDLARLIAGVDPSSVFTYGVTQTAKSVA